MRLLRRFVTICALGAWLGGIAVYSLVVVRASHAVIGNREKVGFVTQKVTLGLNAIGSAALAILLVDAACAWKTASKWNRLCLGLFWGVAAAADAWVYVLHSRLDAMLDFQVRHVREGVPFRGLHETYLIGTTVEWIAGMAFLLAALAAWRSEDRVTPDRT